MNTLNVIEYTNEFKILIKKQKTTNNNNNLLSLEKKYAIRGWLGWYPTYV